MLETYTEEAECRNHQAAASHHHQQLKPETASWYKVLVCLNSAKDPLWRKTLHSVSPLYHQSGLWLHPYQHDWRHRSHDRSWPSTLCVSVTGGRGWYEPIRRWRWAFLFQESLFGFESGPSVWKTFHSHISEFNTFVSSYRLIHTCNTPVNTTPPYR